MSQSPEMGLLGSKDEETKKETKAKSPDCYAPYCIDSDSETYDTEALSIMDINDIIGIQSEPVSDSTLESEIAALSQIITDSKTDDSQSMIEMMESQQKDVTMVEEAFKVENIYKVQTSDTKDLLNSDSKGLENVCSAEDSSAVDMEHLKQVDKQFSSDNTTKELNNQETDGGSKDTCTVSELTDYKTIVDTNVTEKMDVECVRSESDSTSVTLEVKNTENVNRSDKIKQESNNFQVKIEDNKVAFLENENSIKGSLQLIGEAYSSEDSQEMSINDTEPTEPNPSLSFKENFVHSKEEKKTCESEQNVNILLEVSDNINSDKISVNKDIPIGTVENQVHVMEVDAPACSIESKHTEELLTLEKKEDIVPKECKEDIVLQYEKEDNADSTDVNKKNDVVKEEIQEKEVRVETTEKNEIMDVEINEDRIETGTDVNVLEHEKCKSVAEEVQKSVEIMDAEKEENFQREEECMDVEEEEKNESEECNNEETRKSLKSEECLDTEEGKSHQGKEYIDENKHESLGTEEPISEEKESNQESEEHISEENNKSLETEQLISEEKESNQESEEHISEENNKSLETEQLISEEKESNQESEEHISEENNKSLETEQLISEEKESNQESEGHISKEYNKSLETEKLISDEKNKSLNTEQLISEKKESSQEIKEYISEENNESLETEQLISEEKESNQVSEDCISEEKNKSQGIEDVVSEENERSQGTEETIIEEEEKSQESEECISQEKEKSQESEECISKNQEIEESIIEDTKESQESEELAKSQETEESVNKETAVSQESEEQEKNLETEESINEEQDKSQENVESVSEGKERVPETEENVSERHVDINETVNTDIDTRTIQQETESETGHIQCELQSTDDSNATKLQESDLWHTTNNSEVLQSKPDAIELSQTEKEVHTEKLEPPEEIQENSLILSTSQSVPMANDKTPVNIEDNSAFVTRENIKLSPTMENLLDNAVSGTDTVETDIEMQTEHNKNLDLVSSESETKTLLVHESEDEIMESSIGQDKCEDELKTRTPENSDTLSKSEGPKPVDDTLNFNSPASVLQSDTISTMDTSIVEDDSESKMDIVEESNDTVKHEMEVSNVEAVKIADSTSEEQSQELTEVKDTITEESFDIKEVPSMLETSKECIESKGLESSENFTEETEIGAQTLQKKEIDVSSAKTVVEQEELTEDQTTELKGLESTCNVDKEENSEQFMEDKETVIQNEEDVQTDLQISDSITNVEIQVLEEDAKEKHEEKEMNVPLESEEVVSQFKTGTNDPEEKSDETMMAEISEEMDKEVQENTVTKMDTDNSEISDKNSEKAMNLDNTEDSMSSKNEESLNKQQLEDNYSKDDDRNNLKNILETANNVEMFSEEQCQSTQDIVNSILDNVGGVTDFKNILTTETGVTNEIEKVLEQSADLPLVEPEMDEMSERLPQDSDDILNKEMEDPISNQNMDSLEGLLGLDLMPEGEESSPKIEKAEEPQEQETLPKDVDVSLLLDQSNSTSDVTQASDYITDVISSCLADRNAESVEDNAEKANVAETINDKAEETETDVLKVDASIVQESVDKESASEDLHTQLESNSDVPENELDMDFEDAPLESADDLEETETKLELDSDILLQNVDQGENLNEVPIVAETSQPSSEISELESAVKFLQESEEQAIDSPLGLSPKMVESVVDDISKQVDPSSIFVPDEDLCEDTSELVVELQDIATDSISISEAEIISEAAKLENERKLAEQVKMEASMTKFKTNDDKQEITKEEKVLPSETESKFDVAPLQNIERQQAANVEKEKVPEATKPLPQNVLKTSETIPKVSILEERLKEPPKIEIPVTDVTKVSISPTTSKDSLLIQKDAKLFSYQKMLESPKLSEKSEPKIMDTPRKDSEKHDFENVGSPRIILKIAKSAIADCGEPRSPKSPKIRSAANSPNPEDSPGQKLGKIKLKLSKSGHPSIISNENIEEAGQWYSEGSSSLSPIGMKIKLSKSGDASIVSSEKHESVDDLKDGKHKFEEMKRTESPIGMKIKLSKSGDASIVQQDTKEISMKHKDKLDIVQGSPKRTESPIGMKIKLSKSGDASIIQPERQEPEEHRDNSLKTKEKFETSYDSPKRTDSPIGMKIKLSKTGDASIVAPDVPEDTKEAGKTKDNSPEIPKRTDSPLGMKIKLAKTKGGASIISMENPEEPKEKLEIPDVPKRTESPLGMKIKLSKTGDASIVHSEVQDEVKDIKQKEKMESKEKSEVLQDALKSQDQVDEAEAPQEPLQKVESPIGMKIKLSKFGDASIVSTDKQEQPDEAKSLQETPKRTESPIGMKIKLSKTGDASIIQPETSEEASKTTRTADVEHSKAGDASLGMKIKLLKSGDASIVDSEKKERQQRRRDTESPLEMKIKLSKTGHPTIVACDSHGEPAYKSNKEAADTSHGFAQRYKESSQNVHKEPALKILKSGHSTILQSNRSELTIEPVQMQSKKADNMMEISPKRKEITIAPIEAKKSKLETQLTQILPEVTIQPVSSSRDQKQFLFDPKSSAISLQQMNVISQEISITQVRPSKPTDTSMTEKLKDILGKNVSNSPLNSDCEIIEHRPELIIVNENSNSSQDVMIIEEVSHRMPEVKIPKKRGRPRRNPMIQPINHSQLLMPRDPLSLDEQQMQQPQVPHFESRENERPKRTCRSQKSYAPPKRGRGRGRGKRKLDATDVQVIKKPRMEQDLSAIEAATTAVITIDGPLTQQESFGKSPELYKALKQPPMDSKAANPIGKADKKAVGLRNDGTKNANVANSVLPDSTGTQMEIIKTSEGRLEHLKTMPKPMSNESRDSAKDKRMAEVTPEKLQKSAAKADEKSDKMAEIAKSENKDILIPPGHPNWLTPTSKKAAEGSARHENVSTVQVIDEETRMSAESGSRSQTPARNISAPASETIVNEESQGSVLSTATTESEKVKVKNRRMEINFDPDEGPFTVDKIAEYEWPLDRKGETFMIQEQISQYLGVKSFKRKYPDLKRRVVDMEERNYLRENGLVSEAMCDMGLTAICSSEVLDVMCSDFPDQYEEYRKHMREKQVKEHSKKQKELSAAANAEKNRIDLAEMAVQSALAWNINLNKARRETRKCSLDLQTFTIHVPKKQQKVEAERKVGHYPVALIPGQYTDYYREYTPAELRYYPLNTVLYGPMRPNERKFDSQSEGSQSDSDSDSSSDDSSSSSSEGTQDTEGSQSTMDDVDMEIVNQKDEVKLKCKMCLKILNKHSKNEVLIQCGTCNGHVHPSCIDLTLDMVPHIQSYAWQCTDCKTCAQCHDPADEDKMLFCDMCDRGYHIYCVGLRRVPQGRWHCQECAVCANCGSREPGGLNSDRNSVAQWQHEYKKGDKNTRVYVSTLCVPCSKLWRKGRYCPHCSRCHTASRLDLEANLVHCSACDKYLHLGCVETKGIVFDRKNYLCDFCAPNRQQVVKPLVSKTLKT